MKALENRAPWWLCYLAFFCAIVWICMYFYATTSDYEQYRSMETMYKERIISLERKLIIAREKAKEAEELKIDQALAIKNNNPLNVKTVPGGWRGQKGTDQFGHAVFQSPEYGIRAASIILLKYYSTCNLCTLQDIINRFCEKNRTEYVSFLAKRLELAPEQAFDVSARLPELLAAMARFESGKEWNFQLFVPYTTLIAMQ